MIFLVQSLLAVAVFIAAFDLIFVVRNSLYLRQRKVVSRVRDRRLAIVMAVFEETETSSDAVRFLQSEACKDVDEIIIVGNARERNSLGVNATLDAGRSLLVSGDKIRVIECDEPNAIKAHQVNYAVRRIEGEPAQTWLYVMDVDTRFAKENIALIRNAIFSNHQIIQQHTHFLEGLEGNSILGQSFAAHQTRWTLAHEMTRILVFNGFGVGLYHLVGHGMCINVGVFLELGGFSENVKIEDIHFGYMCCMRGMRVYSVPMLEGSDTPSDLRSLWQQQYGWSLGAFQIGRYWVMLKDSGYQTTTYNHFQNIFGVWNYVRWLLQAPFIWFVLLVLVSGISLWLPIVFLSLYLTSFFVAGFSMKRLGYLDGSILRYAILGFGNSLIRSLPVIHCFFDRLTGVERRKYKTRHRKL